jgi:hypothetical protein
MLKEQFGTVVAIVMTSISGITLLYFIIAYDSALYS